MDNWKDDRIGSALKGENPTVLARMKSGFAVIADPQFLPGYCVLLAYPKVFSLNNLSLRERETFLLEMSLIGDAISEICKPIRINYDILGNTDTFLHAHIYPRYEWEEERKKHPIWVYPKEYWTDEKYQFNEVNSGQLKRQLSLKIKELLEINNY